MTQALSIFNCEETHVGQIIKDGKIWGVSINDKEFDRFGLLALATEMPTKKLSWEIMQAASMMFHSQDDRVFNRMYGTTAAWLVAHDKSDEFTLQGRFKKSVPYLFGGCATLVEGREDRHHIPDAWVSINGVIHPVEVKRKSFDFKAYQQLRRYMAHFGCIGGVAVGEKLTTLLPAEIIFISSSEIETICFRKEAA